MEEFLIFAEIGHLDTRNNFLLIWESKGSVTLRSQGRRGFWGFLAFVVVATVHPSMWSPSKDTHRASSLNPSPLLGEQLSPPTDGAFILCAIPSLFLSLPSTGLQWPPPKACLQPQITKFLPGKPMPAIPLRYLYCWDFPRLGLAPHRNIWILFFAHLHLPCAPESHATRATSEVTIFDQTGTHSQEAWWSEPFPRSLVTAPTFEKTNPAFQGWVAGFLCPLSQPHRV